MDQDGHKAPGAAGLGSLLGYGAHGAERLSHGKANDLREDDRDWIMAQMAIIEAGQVEMEEVFFPYLTDRNGKTLYQLYQGGQLALGRKEE